MNEPYNCINPPHYVIPSLYPPLPHDRLIVYAYMYMYVIENLILLIKKK